MSGCNLMVYVGVLYAQGSIAEELFETLMEYHKFTVQLLSAQAAPNSEVHTAYLQRFKVWCSKLQVPYGWNLNLISWHDINHV